MEDTVEVGGTTGPLVAQLEQEMVAKQSPTDYFRYPLGLAGYCKARGHFIGIVQRQYVQGTVSANHEMETVP